MVEQVNKTVEKSTTSEAAAAHAKAAIGAFENLRWDGEIHGFKAGGSGDDLTLWFTTDWLKTDHEDQMFELLASDPGITDGSTSCIELTHFVRILAQAYSDPDKYCTAHHFGWLQRLGTSIGPI
jgi:predicted component of type VI protein secretion system